MPLYLLTKIGSEGRGPARRRVSSGASPAAELPLWSQLIPACPIPLERLQLIRPKAAFSFYGIPPPRLYGGYKRQTLSSA